MDRLYIYKLRKLVERGELSPEETELMASGLYKDDADFFALLQELSYDTPERLTRPIETASLSKLRKAATSILRKLKSEPLDHIVIKRTLGGTNG